MAIKINAKVRKILLYVALALVVLATSFGVRVMVGSCKRNDLKDATASFTVYAENGKKVELSDFYGKPIVVNFWATWCSPCQQEMPHFDDAYAEYKSDVKFLMVNLTTWEEDASTSEVKSFIEKKGYDFPIYYDKDGDAAKTYGVESIPLTLFIGKDGKVAHTYTGAMKKTQLYNYIEKII